MHTMLTFGRISRRLLSTWNTVGGKNPRGTFDLYLFNEAGNHEIKRMNKATLIKETGLMARDLIVLDSGYHRRPRPVILVRPSAIVVSLSYIRAIIRSDCVYLFQPNLDVVRRFCEKFGGYLNGKRQPFLPSVNLGDRANSLSLTLVEDEEVDNEESGIHHLPYELRALEGILSSVCRRYHNRTMILSPLVKNVLHSLSSRPVDPDILNQLFPVKNTLSEFEIETAMFRNLLTELIHNEEDMLAMLLSEKERNGGKLAPQEQHSVVELLLENYCSQLVDIAQESYYLRKRVESTQSIIELKLDTYRNHMLRLSIQLATGSVALTLGTLFSGYFGANLTNGFEDHPTAFFWLGGFSVAGISGLFIILKNRVDASVPKGLEGNLSDTIFDHLDEIQQLLGVAKSRQNFGSEQLTRHEMSSLLRKIAGVKIAQEEVEILFKTFDLDKNGIIDPDEVASASDKAMLEHPMPFK